MKKLFAGFMGLTMSLSLAFPIGANAQTTSDLQAQINNLLAIIAQLQAQLSGGTGGTGTSTPTTGFTFTQDLTVGSRGNQVTELQRFLVARGHLTIPPGVALGYFGPLTRTALAAFQSAQGISPAAGYFGPITRTRINAILNAQTPTTPGTGTTTPGTGGISTPGVEGTMTVSSTNAGVRSTVFEDENMVNILGIEVEARQSDIAVQRVRLNLGSSSTLYNRILEKLYVTDESNNVLATVDLNSSNVSREGNNYFVTITGFNYVVPRNGERSLFIKADVRPSIDTSDLANNYTISLADNGIRGIDGAGIDHFGPATGSSISRTINVDESLSESATLRLSLNTASPKTQEVIASSGSNNDELDRLPLLTFDARAERDDVTMRDLTVAIQKTGSGGANASSTAYLYDGSTEIDNASVSAGSVTFSDVDLTIPRDTTRTLSVRVDIRNANATEATFRATASSTGVVAENQTGDELEAADINGSVTGYDISVRNVGPEITLVSRSITTSGVPQGGGSNNLSTSTLTATFNIRLRAVGDDIMFGTTASSTPAFPASCFGVYRNGARDNSISSAATSTSFSIPSGVTTAGLTNSFLLSEGNEVTIPVTFQILGRAATTGAALTSGLYSVGLECVQWNNGTANTTDFMAGEVDWRTNDVSFP